MKHSTAWWAVFDLDEREFQVSRGLTRDAAEATFRFVALPSGKDARSYIESRGYTVRRVTTEWEG